MSEAGDAIDELLALMDRLRDPGGCPWDREQSLDTLRTYLLEEAYETVAAMRGDDWGEIGAELGDLLFQIVFVSKLGKETGAFDFAAVARGIHAKMVSRHPHVFGDSAVDGAEAVVKQWESLKAAESRAAGRKHLDGIPESLPALLKAYRLTERAAGLGFDWQRVEDVVDKLEEELEEWKAEIRSTEPGARQRAVDELGDILFVVANLARQLGIDPEDALQRTNGKFRRRFEAIGDRLEARGDQFEGTPLAELDRLWNEVKSDE